MKAKRRTSRRLIRSLIYLLVLFLFQEVALRICFPLPEIRNFDRIAYLAPEVEGARYTRNETRFWQSSVDTNAVFEHHMNRYGFRDAEWKVEKPAGKKRALFIGDSFVEGVMAAQDQTIPQGFRAAAGEGQWEALNAGIVGKGLSEYLQLAADMIPIFKPEVAFLCIYANDLGKNEPAVPQFYLEPEYFSRFTLRFYDLMKESRTHGPVLPIWDGGKRAYLPAVPEAANPWTDHAAELAPHVGPRLAGAMKNGTLNPFRTNALRKEAGHLNRPPHLGETVPFFQYTCAQNGVEPVVVYIPSRHQVTGRYYPYEREMCRVDCPDSLDLTTSEYQLHARTLAEHCRMFKVRFIDLTELIREEEARGRRLFWNYDEHMRGEGYLLLGKVIAERWRGR